MEKIFSKLPLGKQRMIIVEPARVVIPAKIDKKELYKNYKDLIFSTELTTEKAVYLALLSDRAPYVPPRELLVQTLINEQIQ